MKKLKKLQLKSATIMTAPQMKHITGGYGTPDGTGDDGYNKGIICRWSWTGMPNDPNGSNWGYCHLNSVSECEQYLHNQWGPEGNLEVSCS